jgi:alanyl-tRNA synthetase
MTDCLFVKNSYLFEANAKVMSYGVDERGAYLVIDRTIFYPQGGGQPSDVGSIECHDVSYAVGDVKKDGGIIKHYIAEECTDDLKGAGCICSLDIDVRILHMRYHSAGHLLGNIVESICKDVVATKAHCFPDEAYVEFHGTGDCDRDAVAVAMKAAVAANWPIVAFEVSGDSFERKFYKLPYAVPLLEMLRVVQIGANKPIPCGGTHLESTADIGNFEITKVKNKNGNLRVSFAII